MNKRENEILKIGFKFGKRAIEMHPDNDDYDWVRLQEAEEVVKKLTIPIFSNPRELLIDFLDKLENTQDKAVPYNRNGVIADKYLEGNL